FLAAPPERTSHVAATELTALLRRTLAGDANDKVVQLWDHTLAQHPDDVLVIQGRAAFLRSISRFEEAIESYEVVRDYPRPKVSPEGALLIELKKSANVSIGACGYEQWAVRTANAQRLDRGSEAREAMIESAQEALDRAKQSRDLAIEDLPEDEPSLILLNARIAYAEGEIRAADVLTRRYNEATNELDAEGVRLASDIARRLEQPGEQRRLLSRLLSINPNDVRGLIQLAEVEINLRNYEEAERRLLRASELAPDLEIIDNQLTVLAALLGKTEIEDPIEAAIIEAQRASNEGDMQGAVDVLEAALRDNPTPETSRAHAVLANALLQTNQPERAAEIAEAGLAITPDSTSLRIIVRQARVGNDLDAADDVIDSIEGLTDTQRNLRKHAIRLAQGQDEAAAPFLQAARDASPDDPAVLTAAFEYALRIGDLDDARAIFAETQGRDIDGANGLTFRAGIEIAEGRYEEAERTLTAAVERGSLNAATLNLLGRVQSLRGDNIAAVESFRRARDIRPNDIALTNAYIRSLAAAGREPLALDAARESLDLGRNNPQFVDIWLALEGSFGSKQVAYDQRVAISEARPQDAANTASLIRLCLDLRRFDEARERLDAARAERDTLALCELDAIWHLQRGDLRAATDQFNEFLISDAEGANSAAAYVTYGSFLIDNGQLDSGLTTLRQGRRLQSPDNPVVDLELSRRLFNAQRYQDAVDVLESVVDGPAGDSPAATQSQSLLIETFVRLRDWDSAQARVDALPEDQRETLTTRLLEVEIARGRGETAQARIMLDETISAFPNEPLPYIRRGTLLMPDSALIPDAIDDLTRAIELDPSNADAYRFRSICHTRLGRTAEAAEDVIATARARPLDDSIRISAASRLIEMGREDLASDVIDEGLERQAGNLRILFNAGQLFANADNHTRAVQYLRDAWEQSREPAVADALIRSMLELPRPDLRRARQIVTHPDLDQESPGVLLMRASIESAAENWSAAESLLAEVYRTNRDNPPVLFTWSRAIDTSLDTRERGLDFLARLDAAESLSPWGRFMRARLLSRDESGTSQAEEILTGLITSGAEQNLRLASLRLRSLVRYEQDNFEAAVEDIRTALETVPDDPELNNNLAYILGVELGRGTEALPFAERAVEIAPENRGFLDTLGTVLIEAGQPDAAIEPLERALTLATTDTQRAPVLVHLARARLETGNRPGAAEAANEARRIMDDIDEPDETTKAQLEDVLRAIDSAR
ncbi:MAG: tetratricopeptide repeat protein, partial [Planctomycetota bacterium]